MVLSKWFCWNGSVEMVLLKWFCWNGSVEMVLLKWFCRNATKKLNPPESFGSKFSRVVRQLQICQSHSWNLLQRSISRNQSYYRCIYNYNKLDCFSKFENTAPFVLFICKIYVSTATTLLSSVVSLSVFKWKKIFSFKKPDRLFRPDNETCREKLSRLADLSQAAAESF
jgi:hypothetical protein